jgi:hypothetical protein
MPGVDVNKRGDRRSYWVLLPVKRSRQCPERDGLCSSWAGYRS